MLLFLISSLFVLSNGVPLQLQPLKSFNATNLIAKLADGGSAKNLIAELADADPAKVQEVITLVEAMIGVAQNDLNALTVTSTDANSAYTAAVSTYDAAVVAQTQGVTTLQTAVTDALAAKNNAEGAKTGAQSSLDAEKSRLEAEIASLQQVVTILKGLSASNVVAVTVGPETLITPAGRDGWTSFSMINTNAFVPAHESNLAVRLVGWQWNGFDDNNMITLQIYRPSSGNNYQLIGQFSYGSQKGFNEMVLADGLAVESGDCVGWTFHGNAAVGHTGGSDSVLWGLNTVQFNTVGNTYNFPGRGGRNYPIKANFEIYA